MDPEEPENSAAGWSSSFPSFASAPAREVRRSLETFVRDAGASQLRAWDDSIPRLQTETREIMTADSGSEAYTAILEFRLPLESRRADVVLLARDSVLVLELKGRQDVTQGFIDQVAAYARDLRAYHRDCEKREVHAVLVPVRSSAEPRLEQGVWVTGPAHLDALVLKLSSSSSTNAITAARFLEANAYRPMPSLVQAARELFNSGEVREVWRARAATDPAVRKIAEIAHEAARTKTRHLVLVTGVPGSGKTLVGMRAVHAHFLDDLAVPRSDGRPTAPGLFLSGNGPLVEVLQYVLKAAGGGGRTFVRHIKDYLDFHAPRPERVPSEHLLVFDEAQRAFAPEMVRKIHKHWPETLAKSEPQHFVEICGRMPEWSVLVGLIGTGQEIYIGEEGGLIQWREALESAPDPERWTLHAPALIEEVFSGSSIRTRWAMELNLDTELRFHTASKLHKLVGRLLGESGQSPHSVPADDRSPGEHSGLDGLSLWATRDLETAKRYIRERYEDVPDARFGLLTSSRDKLLASHGIDNSWQGKVRRKGPWFTDGEESPDSCRHLLRCVSEFDIQGLELDMALLGWGSDLVRENGRWNDSRARKYKAGPVPVRDKFQLRLNAYRVLLTRGRDGTVIFVPRDQTLDETWDFLLGSGFSELDG